MDTPLRKRSQKCLRKESMYHPLNPRTGTHPTDLFLPKNQAKKRNQYEEKAI
jgi:hypothetical protein